MSYMIIIIILLFFYSLLQLALTFIRKFKLNTDRQKPNTQANRPTDSQTTPESENIPDGGRHGECDQAEGQQAQEEKAAAREPRYYILI